jgi:hypothetical protein
MAVPTISMRNRPNVREWTHVLFVNTPCSHLAQLLRNWLEQRPRNQCGIDSGVTGQVGWVYYTGVDVLLIVVGLRFKWYTPWNARWNRKCIRHQMQNHRKRDHLNDLTVHERTTETLCVKVWTDRTRWVRVVMAKFVNTVMNLRVP